MRIIQTARIATLLSAISINSICVTAFTPSFARTVTQKTLLKPHTGTVLPPSGNKHPRTSPSSLHMFSPDLLQTISDPVFPSSLLSFSDQGQNLAGIFFQASLLPYITFLYFLGFKGNRTPALGQFGFSFLLLFVLGTIPSGIIAKSVYGVSLANCDWLHGGAELLLTLTSLLVVLGFRQPSTEQFSFKPRYVGLGAAAAFTAALALGPSLGFDAHSSFLFGVGDLSGGLTSTLPWVTHPEPINALSLPTWAIHFSSVFEWIFAMSTIWTFASATDNPKWKGLTWGMIPLHASGLAACTYHFFYNNPELQYLVSLQAGLTLLGNITCAIAAYRIAVSNGWTAGELNPFPKSKTDVTGIAVDSLAVLPYEENFLSSERTQDGLPALLAKLGGLTLVMSYAVKYGELGLDVPFAATPNALIAGSMVVLPAALTGYAFVNRAAKESDGTEGGNAFSSLFSKSDDDDSKPSMSMADVKKYGVAGTVAYVLTELAFWAVAFPVASYALYETSGHWPDVVNNDADRATVLGFIFAGANVARLAVPLRFGAALALAPWVDDNIIQKFGGDSEEDGI